LRLANRTRRGEAALRKVPWAWASSPWLPSSDPLTRADTRDGALDAAGATLLLRTTGLRAAAAWIGLGAPTAVTHMAFESPLLGTGKEKGPR